MTPHEQEVAEISAKMAAVAQGETEMATYASPEELHADLFPAEG